MFDVTTDFFIKLFKFFIDRYLRKVLKFYQLTLFSQETGLCAYDESGPILLKSFLPVAEKKNPGSFSRYSNALEAC